MNTSNHFVCFQVLFSQNCSTWEQVWYRCLIFFIYNLGVGHTTPAGAEHRRWADEFPRRSAGRREEQASWHRTRTLEDKAGWFSMRPNSCRFSLSECKSAIAILSSGCICQELSKEHIELTKQVAALQSRIDDRDSEIHRLRNQERLTYKLWIIN